MSNEGQITREHRIAAQMEDLGNVYGRRAMDRRHGYDKKWFVIAIAIIGFFATASTWVSWQQRAELRNTQANLAGLVVQTATWGCALGSTPINSSERRRVVLKFGHLAASDLNPLCIRVQRQVRMEVDRALESGSPFFNPEAK